MKHPTLSKTLRPALIGVLLPVVAVAVGCEKDEPPPPLPEATAEEKPTAPLQLEAEDAGEEDAGDDTPKAGGPFKPKSSGLKACCNALTANAQSAPPPTNAYMIQAAAFCHQAAASGQDNATALSAIGGMLKGAGLPGACR